MTPEKAAAMLRSALELANRAVYEQSQLSEDFTGMGTTLVAAFLSRGPGGHHQRRRQPRLPF